MMEFSTVLLITGIVLVLLGLTGKIEIQQVKVGTNTKYIRVLSIFIGIFFIILSLLFELHVPHNFVNETGNNETGNNETGNNETGNNDTGNNDTSINDTSINDENINDASINDAKEIVIYTHIIEVSGSDGISLRTKALDESQLELQDDSTYITTLMNGHKVQILSKTSNWYQVKTLIDGKLKEGFISGYYKSIPTVKKINTQYLWKGVWYTTWNNPMSYNTSNNQIIEFYNSDLSSFFGRYTYNSSKKSQIIEGNIINIVFNNNNLKGDWIEKDYEGNEVCQGHLEFLMFSDKKSFIGRYNRKCKNSKKYRIWKGERKAH